MRVQRLLGLALAGLFVVLTSSEEARADHRHYRGCGHRVVRELGYGYDNYGYGDDNYGYGGDYDGPYRYQADPRRPYGRGWSGPYRDGYRYSDRRYSRRNFDRRYDDRRYDDRRSYGRRFHYHGRDRCYRSHRPRVGLTLHLDF